MLHGFPHPGPLKYTVLLEASKFEPFRVIVKACPFTGGFGLLLILLSCGGEAGADTVRETAFEVSPVVLFLTVTLKLPVARIAWPEIWLVLPLALMTTYPALALLGKLTPATAAGALLGTAAFAAAARTIWLASIRHYTSASS